MIVGFAFGLLLVALQTCFVMLAGHVHWVRTRLLALRRLDGFARLRNARVQRGAGISRVSSATPGRSLWDVDRTVGSCTRLCNGTCGRGGIHGGMQILGAFTGSLLFGMAALAMRGLAVPIGLHTAWNFGQWTLGEKETSGPWRPVVEQGYKQHVDHMGILGYLLVFGSATVAFYLFGTFRRTASESTPWK